MDDFQVLKHTPSDKMKKYKHEKVKVFFTILPIHTPFWVFLIDFHRFLLQFKVVV